MNPKQAYYKTQAQTIIKHLNTRRMKGYYCPTKEEAVKTAMELTAPDTVVSFGGSMTLLECGIMNALKARNDIRLIDRARAETPEEIKQAYRDSFSADTYFMSTNAITLDGQLVNIDGNGNRAAALIYGPDQVIVVAGMNKVTSTVEDAIRRVHNIASPPNCIRLNKKTPCASSGVCAECLGEDCICSHTVITRRSGTLERIKVLLVGEELGY
ncbi:MAG: lactate utilization protein [Eubacterium sp.]|nr:lactate utilization protein [Eubacterium sp.]MCI8919302.1 lactate utilization protein [Eubacterium sp.]